MSTQAGRGGSESTQRGPVVTGVDITPVAIADPPLLNASGVHEPFQLRSIIQVRTDAGITGVSEAYGDDATLAQLRQAAATLPGLDVFHLNDLTRRVSGALASASASSPTELIGAASADKTVAQAVSAFEVACFDIQGKATGKPVVDLLGGAVRDRVDFSAYLFYKWAEHPGDYPADDWGAALDPDGIVAQARRMVELYGFGSLKLKGGVFAPEEEVAAVKALRAAFPDRPVRLDPNANWSVETSHRVAAALEGELEYLEDPTAGIPGMAEVAAKTSLPLATNMCVTGFAEIPEAVRLGAVQVILSDHHFWGGFRATQALAGLCETFGLGLSMHSNTHLGISLAAMTHLAAATPNLTYALDTHSPWKTEEVIAGGPLRFVGGALTVPEGPGLGVAVDEDALARLHEQYLTCGFRKRDDATWMRRVQPEFTGRRPRF
ncbi:Mandelate racemase/muconate lactonizing protein [Catenulispora acidiphila DSM 44928]|uniref:glucarate dehydratase n=1 Tax=Catenulispora acidiphila (strain DSM 44928 / JCM 14897 / NBRC 102108 / NRRL B-24433 / ID139908) TaxID=479433 RepID=C7Q6I0_CATAD|nr:glucarate dehydratase family protein [Catenulispora acidiphila]ACU74015.1 Mandelate racemase/muconate lactonizing protein [Catenulispora acidiphila DSM 44928]